MTIAGRFSDLPTSLISGHGAFHAATKGELGQQLSQLKDGQSPKVFVISCVDSRVDPATLFGSAPGEIFVTRNVANLVPAYAEQASTESGSHGTETAIEYAVKALKVEHIVVLGHAGCGGVGACIASKSAPLDFHFIGSWISLLDQARDKVLDQGADDPQVALEHEGVRASLERLADYPFVATALERGALKLHGGWFNIGEAQLYWMDGTGRFAPVES